MWTVPTSSSSASTAVKYIKKVPSPTSINDYVRYINSPTRMIFPWRGFAFNPGGGSITVFQATTSPVSGYLPLAIEYNSAGMDFISNGCYGVRISGSPANSARRALCFRYANLDQAINAFWLLKSNISGTTSWMLSLNYVNASSLIQNDTVVYMPSTYGSTPSVNFKTDGVFKELTVPRSPDSFSTQRSYYGIMPMVWNSASAIVNYQLTVTINELWCNICSSYRNFNI